MTTPPDRAVSPADLQSKVSRAFDQVGRMVSENRAMQAAADIWAGRLRDMRDTPLVQKMRVATLRCPMGDLIGELYGMPDSDAPGQLTFLVVPTQETDGRGAKAAWLVDVKAEYTATCREGHASSTWTLEDLLFE